MKGGGVNIENIINILYDKNLTPYDSASAIATELIETTILNMSNYNIGDDGASKLAQALETNNTLTTLNIGNNNIPEREIMSLQNYLTRNITINLQKKTKSTLQNIILSSLKHSDVNDAAKARFIPASLVNNKAGYNHNLKNIIDSMKGLVH